MTNKESIEILRSICVYDVYPKSASEETKQAIDFAIKAIKDVDRLEEENHRNFVNSQHIISSLIEEIKILKKEIKKLKRRLKNERS